ncbi:MAG TPA: RDD family protein [Armatimonadota bacterium]|nr:RDD family protein [Armatimonadota bacterium]
MDYEHVTIETPEHVNISYELAGIGSRLMACILDHVILYLLILAIILGAMAVGFETELSKFTYVAIGLLAGGFFLFHVVYFVVFEGLWNGQTPGKRAAGIRVMRDDGTPASTIDILTRNAVRLIDYLPWFYFVGGIASFANGQSKRLGDMAAGTVVVKLRESALVADIPPIPTAPMPPPTEAAMPAELAQMLAPSASRITRDEYAAIRRFLGRRFELTPAVRQQMAGQMLTVVHAKLLPDAQVMGQQDPEGLLEALHQLGLQSGRAT